MHLFAHWGSSDGCTDVGRSTRSRIATPLTPAERALALGLVLGLAGCARTSTPVKSPSFSATHGETAPQIFGPRAEGTPRDLLEEGCRAVLEHRWQAAIDALETLRSAEPKALGMEGLHALATAHEQLGHIPRARDTYRDLRFLDAEPRAPQGTANTRHDAARWIRSAQIREAALDAYLEDWDHLLRLSETLWLRSDRDDGLTILALAARGLAKLKLADERAAKRDIEQALERAEESGVGRDGQLPVALAMMHYANGELRNKRSSAIDLPASADDFVTRLETRCSLLLDAQASYAEAIRASDPLWVAMGGLRVAEMYAALHAHLIAIEPTKRAKTERDRQLFRAVMRVRYRPLLDKSREMLRRIRDVPGAWPDEPSLWTERAARLEAEVLAAQHHERAWFATLPFTEGEVARAIELMKDHARSTRRAVQDGPAPIDLPR